MMIPPIVAIYGNSDSGKTSLIEDLLEDLVAEGLEVCTVKHTPGEYSLDEPGKDTWKHKRAGSSLTVFSSGNETDFLFPEKMDLEKIHEIVGGVCDCDLVIAEGYKNAEVPKIAVGDIELRDHTIQEYNGDFIALKRSIQELIEVRKVESDLPSLDCGRCGYESCLGLAKAITKDDKELDDCEVRKQRTVDLKVNGEKVPLENFPASFVEGGLKGMLQALKGVDDRIDSISLEIRN